LCTSTAITPCETRNPIVPTAHSEPGYQTTTRLWRKFNVWNSVIQIATGSSYLYRLPSWRRFSSGPRQAGIFRIGPVFSICTSDNGDVSQLNGVIEAGDYEGGDGSSDDCNLRDNISEFANVSHPRRKPGTYPLPPGCAFNIEYSTEVCRNISAPGTHHHFQPQESRGDLG
jgi:hypothetical protein